MARTREIKTRMNAVANIQRITKTMQMIATAKFQAAQKRAVAAKPYTEKISELVTQLAGSGEQSANHPLMASPQEPVGRRLLLVLTSNRGMCGGYNASILRTALGQLNKEKTGRYDLEVVGRKGMGYFRFAGTTVDQFHSQITDTPALADVNRLADRYIEAFTSGQYDSVEVIYMAFESAGRQRPEALTLLPMRTPTQDTDDASGPSPTTDYDYSPAPEQLLANLVPKAVKAQLFQCFNEAVVSEHIARMVAMKSATDAAGKIGKGLKRTYNRARQTAITTELTEIISGTAALE